jgi:hypothetical protein
VATAIFSWDQEAFIAILKKTEPIAIATIKAENMRPKGSDLSIKKKNATQFTG